MKEPAACECLGKTEAAERNPGRIIGRYGSLRDWFRLLQRNLKNTLINRHLFAGALKVRVFNVAPEEKWR